MNRLKYLLLFLLAIMVTLACPSVWAQETPRQVRSIGVEGKNGTASENNRSVVFLAIRTLPPMSFTQNGRQVGIIVDIAEAIKKEFGRPISLKYMDWSQAQQLVLDGDADALFHINPSEERKKIFDFSDGLLQSDFSIFIKTTSENIYGTSELKSLRVGVLNRGLAFNLLSQDPLINLVTFPNILPGYYSLKNGELDAVVMEQKVGTFLLAENNISGIRITGGPIDSSFSTIAVKKGNTELLKEINRALAEIKKNGTYSKIMAKWQPKEVVFQTREQSWKQKRFLLVVSSVAGTALAMVLLFMVWNKSLKQKVAERTSEMEIINRSLEAEIAQRVKAEETMRASRDYLKNMTDSMGDVVFSIKMPERKMEWINDRSKILGYTPEECLGKGTDFFYASRNDYLAIGEILAKAIAEGTDVIHTEADLKRKNGEIFPAEATLTLYKVNNEVVSMTGIVRDVTLRKMADQQLLEYQKRLKALASQLTVAEEKERRRFADDLHDNVCQSLALAKIQVASVRKKVLESRLTAKLDDVTETLQQTLQDTRHLMADLSSPSMNEIGLSAAISEWLEETITKQYNLKTEFADDINDKRRNAMDSDVRTILFRNVRELVTNVVKHAKAKKVSVRIHEEGNRVKIIIKDDGIGFDPEAATPKNRQDSGYGLFSVEERMFDMGGTFEIVSEPDKGCEAILTIPVRKV